VSPLLGLLIIYLLLTSVLLALSVGIGLLLHWILPRLDIGIGVLIGIATTAVSIHFFTKLLAAVSTETDEGENGAADSDQEISTKVRKFINASEWRWSQSPSKRSSRPRRK